MSGSWGEAKLYWQIEISLGISSVKVLSSTLNPKLVLHCWIFEPRIFIRPIWDLVIIAASWVSALYCASWSRSLFKIPNLFTSLRRLSSFGILLTGIMPALRPSERSKSLN